MFTHSLNLALRLVDTTSGADIPGWELEIRIDGQLTRCEEKGGVLIFQNLRQRQFSLSLRSPHYEPVDQAVDLDALPHGLPLMELPMIPSANFPGGTEFLTLEGTLPGISALSAVRSGENACMIREFEPRKRLMKLFNPHHLSLDRMLYGLVDPDHGSYEPFRILHMADDQTAKTDRVLETAFRNYFPVSPMVLGKWDETGRYCLRVRDDGTQARWIIRWEAGGTAHFQTVDFREDPAPRLEGGG